MYVLCVDDDLSFLDLEKRMLERHADIIVEVATSVPEALDRLKVRNYDAVISDYHMNGPTGTDLLRFLRNAGNTVPFIILTGKGNDQVALEAMTEGATFFMEKGYDLHLTFAEIASMIRVSVEGALAKRKALEFKTMCDSLCAIGSSVVLVLDRDGRILDCSASAEAIIGYCREDMIGKAFNELIAGRESHDSTAMMEALMANEVAQVVSLEVRRKDGSRIPAMMCTSALQGIGRDRGRAICVIKDVSEQKVMEDNFRATLRLCADLEEVLDEMVAQSSPNQGHPDPKKVS